MAGKPFNLKKMSEKSVRFKQLVVKTDKIEGKIV